MKNKQKLKLPFYFFWDKTAIIWSIGICFLIVGLLSFTFLPEITRAIKLSKLNGETKGQIIFINPTWLQNF